ncbi:N-acetylmuramoyl-L-alanine amidase [Gracilibacillus sp. YIM 98692]|uniref:N-acetylmuramoyl-L-alanine amidase n=1 Tax=Gracilibacillus sp. YIM 98692 TaxID=2663532 RepID=UPI0013D2F7E9|nr:N-acetylmuramoyl-L-alanine amidase [Gracilibacillus sp. YIM 98692]
MGRRKISFALIFFICFITFPSIIEASEKEYEVGVSNLLLRSEPSSNASIVGQLDVSDKIKVFDESYGWFQTYWNGEEVWVASQFLVESSSTQTRPFTASQNITVNASGVRIRSGPGIDYRILGFTSIGKEFDLLDKSGGWVKVRMNANQTGWIASWLTNENSSKTEDANSTSTASPPSNQDTSNQQALQNGSLQGYNIVLDPGHGGKDPGAIGIGGVYEKDLIMEVVDDIASKLRQAGATVLLTRSNDAYVEHQARVQVSEAYQTHAFISLHFNADPLSTIHGISTHFYGDDNRNLAYTLQNALAQNVNLHSRGVMNDSFYVLRNNSKPSVLLEMGYITNMNDLLTIRTANYRQQLAKGITKGLIDYFH